MYNHASYCTMLLVLCQPFLAIIKRIIIYFKTIYIFHILWFFGHIQKSFFLDFWMCPKNHPQNHKTSHKSLKHPYLFLQNTILDTNQKWQVLLLVSAQKISQNHSCFHQKNYFFSFETYFSINSFALA